MSMNQTAVNRTNLDNGTDLGANARPDLLALVDLINNWITYMGNASGAGASGAGFAMLDTLAQVILGTGATLGINAPSGFLRLTINATYFIEFLHLQMFQSLALSAYS